MTTIQEILAQKKRESKRPFKIKKPAKQRYPNIIEINYENYLLKLVNFTYRVLKTELEPLKYILAQVNSLRPDNKFKRTDAFADDVSSMISKTRIGIETEFSESQLKEQAEKFAEFTSDFNRKQVRKVLSSMVGVDVFMSEPWLLDQISGFANANTALIKSIPEQFLSQVEESIFRTFQGGIRHEVLLKEIRKKYKSTRVRARLIARDQIGKLNGQLTELRQTEVGIESYTWRTMQDRRVRPGHRDREGKIYAWKTPPEDGHPGYAIQCRCYAEPIIKI